MTARPRSRHPADGARRGLTLYEVILALAILLPAMAVLSHGITNGARAAVQARLQTEAILRCDSLIAELIAGARPLTPGDQQEFEDGAPGWTWTLQISGSALHPDLLSLQATVEHADVAGFVNASCTLTREIRDPLLFETDPTLTGEAGL